MRQGGSHTYVSANFISVPNRHEYLREHQVRAQIGDFTHGCFTVANRNDVDALILQSQPNHLLDVAVVVRNQNLGHRTSSGDTLPLRAAIDVRPDNMTSFRVLEHPPKRSSISTCNVC